MSCVQSFCAGVSTDSVCVQASSPEVRLFSFVLFWLVLWQIADENEGDDDDDENDGISTVIVRTEEGAKKVSSIFCVLG